MLVAACLVAARSFGEAIVIVAGRLLSMPISRRREVVVKWGTEDEARRLIMRVGREVRLEDPEDTGGNVYRRLPGVATSTSKVTSGMLEQGLRVGSGFRPVQT